MDSKPNGDLLLKGLNNKVDKAWIVGNGKVLSPYVLSKASWSKVPGLLYISIPEDALDQDVTVVALKLDGRINMYQKGE